MFRLFRLFRLLASLNYTHFRPLTVAQSPVIYYSRTRFVARVPSTANSPAINRLRRARLLDHARKHYRAPPARRVVMHACGGAAPRGRPALVT